ncbi:MAG: hypothetical protein DMG83_00455 [Acidobacteria bacterium]|nr:MAG: hypothetical protein DMG83_00455 [Acidobacteriota bacterium]
MLHIQDFVHAFQAEAALAVEEVGNVRLLEAGLLGEAEAGKIALFNPVPERLAQIFLQRFEFHGQSIARAYSIVIFLTEL